MLAKSRKDYNGVITLHRPVPPHLLHHMSPRSVGQKSSSVEECPYVRRSATQDSTRVVTCPGMDSDKAHTLFPCSVKQLQDRFRSECQKAHAITQPLLDTENGFIKDLECFLNHRDMLSVRKRELLHKHWTESVWWPVQRSIKQRSMCHHYKGAELMKVSTAPLKDPLFLHSHSRMKEKRALHHCQTGYLDGCQWVVSAEEHSRNRGDLYRGNRSRGPVYMATPDGRCFQLECWSSIVLPQLTWNLDGGDIKKRKGADTRYYLQLFPNGKPKKGESRRAGTMQ